MSGAWIVAIIAVAVSWTIALTSPRGRPSGDVTSEENAQRGAAMWTWALLLFGVMLLGILARYYWEFLGRDATRADIDIGEMIRPLLVSPLVFFPVWSQASGQPRSLATVLIAFQNGFFWQAVFEKQA